MVNDRLSALVSGEPGNYVPPVAEYDFLLKEALGTDIVARSTGGALTADDAMDAIASAGVFASEV